MDAGLGEVATQGGPTRGLRVAAYAVCFVIVYALAHLIAPGPLSSTRILLYFILSFPVNFLLLAAVTTLRRLRASPPPPWG